MKRTAVEEWGTVTKGKADGAAVNWKDRATWYESALVLQPNERFVAWVNASAVVELDPSYEEFGLSADDIERVRDSPTVAKLARVAVFFYLQEPVAGAPGDGLLPLPPSPGDERIRERMFAVVVPLGDQTAADATLLEKNGLRSRWHAIRRPRGKLPGHNRKRWAVYPHGDSVLPTAYQSKALVVAAARCAFGPVLVFWPPRKTFLPRSFDAVPAVPEGANADAGEAAAEPRPVLDEEGEGAE